jgi:ATP-dependent DNA helicase DinG
VASAADEAVSALRAVTGRLASAEHRPGQEQMAAAVARALDDGRHLVVQAGTGTGKTLAYLVPAVLSGRRVVVATATKALQDQLASKDLPFLAEQLAAHAGAAPLDWAVLKGRSNYVCLQRLREVADGTDGQLELDDLGPDVRSQVRRLADWASRSETGDHAELDWSPSERAWSSVSVGSDECPGASRCPMGEPCFAERARRRAAAAQVVVVNTHLYGLHVASGGTLLPEHEVVVIDEAHQLEDIMSDTVGVSIGAGRFTFLAAALRRIVDDPTLHARVVDAGQLLNAALASRLGERLTDPLATDVHDALVAGRQIVQTCLDALRSIDTEVEDAKQRTLRAQTASGRLAESLDTALSTPEGSVAYVAGGPDHPRLEVAPLEVGPVLERVVWRARTAVLTSATLPSSLPDRVGLPDGTYDVIDVGSPFDYPTRALLYCALHLPDPRDPGFAAAAHDELAALIEAAAGRTLALFTSYRALDAAVAALRDRLPYPVWSQRDLPKPALLRAFAEDEAACLFATSGFFQGVDIPGRTLSLVVIDRIPFPRPDDPLLAARRDRLGTDAFRQIDLPRAATLLAQAAGRLIRSGDDRGVVAVLDRRLGTAGYRWDIVRALPPMRRTRERAEAEAFLREISAADRAP